MTNEALHAAAAIHADTVALRRRLHRIPEVGNILPKTRAVVLESLDGLPLEISLHESTSGIVAVLEGKNPGPSIILRGDMDALAMPEDTGLDFASEHDGSMHACGHDLHTAMLVGAARLLSDRRDELSGRVVFMFQPGEEGHFGARLMLEEGLLDTVNPPPDRAFALHVTSLYSSGTVNLRPGPMMAAADKVKITLIGRGGHASAPHNATDPVPVVAEIVLAIEVALTRTVNVWDPAVVTFGQISAGTAYNVIPESATLLGTIRTFSAERHHQVHAMVRQVVAGVAAAHGVEATVDIEVGYPVTVNDAAVAGRVVELAAAVAGADAINVMESPIMGAEDWSYVLQRVPGVMAFLGACPAGVDPESAPPNHSNRVIFDEDAMRIGIALHVSMALDHLRS